LRLAQPQAADGELSASTTAGAGFVVGNEPGDEPTEIAMVRTFDS
jgi:hypothetical protein